MIGQTIAHYRILEKLGAGGMGEVYLAHDTRLQRKVALKFLPETLRHDHEARERLLREARAASQLTHPNILTVHAVEETDGRDYIVMEHLDGKPLDEHRRAAQPDQPRILDLVRQIAEGLAAAHKRGVVHRDIKPANILVDADGHLKILDFGLAKQKGLAKLTRDGSTVGTMAYTSPEQVEGREADARSDLFSLGVIAYEMLSGRRPFEGEHEAALVYAIAHEQARPLTIGETVSEGIQRIVHRLLAKRPEDRYQAASELLAELRAIQPPASTVTSFIQPRRSRRGGLMMTLVGVSLAAMLVIGWLLTRKDSGSEIDASTDRKMLVVLPFENLGAADQEYFADGITEEITARLANISSLGVISRTTAMKYKDSEKGVREIGQELKTDYVLEGTIRWDRSRPVHSVRITPQLIRVSDDTHLWADRFERPLEDVFAVQAEIAEKVAEAMNITLAGRERERVTAHPTRNTEAYDLYLRGNEYWNRTLSWLEASLEPAARLYESAIARDSGFAAAYAKLAQVYTEWYYHVSRRPELLAKARDMLSRAAALDPDASEVRLARGSFYYHELDYENAIEQFDHILERQPSNSSALLEKGFVRSRQGRFHEGISLMQQASTYQPVGQQGAFGTDYLIGMYFAKTRMYDSATFYLDREVTKIPDDADAIILRTQLYLLDKGDTASARRYFQDHAGSYRIQNTLQVGNARTGIAAGDYAAVLRQLTPSSPGASQDPVTGAAIFVNRAFVYRAQGDSQHFREMCDNARILLEPHVSGDSMDALAASLLGLAYAGLGRSQDATGQGERAIALAPLEKDYVNNEPYVENLGIAYMWLEQDLKAIQQLRTLLESPTLFSSRLFVVDPVWKDLHVDSRFIELMEQPDKVF